MEPLNTKIDIRKDIRWAFSYFLIVVLLGIFLRSEGFLDYPFSFHYRYIVHTHSHLALLGFVYGLLSAILVRTYLPNTTKVLKEYRKIFYLTQFSVLGMLFSFPFQGYGVVSISFSSLFVICSYWFARFFLKNAIHTSSCSYKFIKMGIFYLILSSIGIWSMPIAIAKFGKFSEVYMCAIAFFLHFQYNGWMLSSLMGLFTQKLSWEDKYPILSKRIFITFQAGIIGSLFISWVGYFSYPLYYIVGGLSVLLWLIAVGAIAIAYLKKKSATFLQSVFIGLFLLKIVMMFTGAFPILTPLLFKNTDLLIAYLHFNFLGIVTVGLVLFLEEVYRPNQWYIYVFLVTFVLTEILIAYRGFSFWFQYPIFIGFQKVLAATTVLFLLPAVGWLIGSFKTKQH